MKPSQLHQGDTIDVLMDIVNTTNAKFGIHLERYPIDQIIDILASAPPAELPHCAVCGKANGLFPCKLGCKKFYCDHCKQHYHVCGSGSDATRGRF